MEAAQAPNHAPSSGPASTPECFGIAEKREAEAGLVAFAGPWALTHRQP